MSERRIFTFPKDVTYKVQFLNARSIFPLYISKAVDGKCSCGEELNKLHYHGDDAHVSTLEGWKCDFKGPLRGNYDTPCDCKPRTSKANSTNLPARVPSARSVDKQTQSSAICNKGCVYWSCRCGR